MEEMCTEGIDSHLEFNISKIRVRARVRVRVRVTWHGISPSMKVVGRSMEIVISISGSPSRDSEISLG